MTDKKPYYNWYASDFLGSQFVQALDLTQECCFRRLLDMQATSETRRISSDPEDLRKQCKWPAKKLWTQIWDRIQRKFVPHPDGQGGLINQRLHEILNEMDGYIGSKSVAGKLGNDRKRQIREKEAKERGTHTLLEWEILKELTGLKCVKCGNDKRPVERDHILSIYKGGSDSIDNLQPLCAPCNSAKGPEEIDFVPQEVRKELAQRTAKSSHSGPQTHSQALHKGPASTSTSISTSKSPLEISSSPLNSPGAGTDDDKGLHDSIRQILREIPFARNVLVSPHDIAKCRSAGVSLAEIETGCWLGVGRHLASSSAGSFIRTFSYFIPIIEEIRGRPPEAGYLEYVKSKIRGPLPAGIESPVVVR